MAAGVNVAQSAEQPGRAFELAVGAELAQLRRMDDWTAARAANAEAILAECRRHAALRVPDLGCNGASCEVDCPGHSGYVHAQYKCYVYVRPERLAEGWSRDHIAADINARGVPCYQGSCSEVYLEKAFDNTGWRPDERLPVARDLGETSLMFLVHPGLTADEIQRTCKVVTEVMTLAAA